MKTIFDLEKWINYHITIYMKTKDLQFSGFLWSVNQDYVEVANGSSVVVSRLEMIKASEIVSVTIYNCQNELVKYELAKMEEEDEVL